MRHLVVGTEAYGMGNDEDGLMEDFVDYLLDMSAHPRLPKLDHLRVGILHKKGRRTVKNIESVHEYLTSRLKVPVDLIPDPGTLPLIDQMKLMRKYALVVTPPGSISFACMFLPRGAAFVHIDYWDIETGRSETMEGKYWGHLSNLVDVRYHVDKTEITPNITLSLTDRIRENSREQTDLGERSEWDLWRNYGDVLIDNERMWTAVRTGLWQVATNWGISEALEIGRAHV